MTRRRRRSKRRTIRPSVSIAGYTRQIGLTATAGATTQLATVDIDGVDNLTGETQNRKIIGVRGQAMFAAALTANTHMVAQFCLWAHPEHEDWVTVADYDPFNDGPGVTGFEGMMAPRPFCRRTFVMNTPNPATEIVETIQTQHSVSSKAERLLRPGWKLTAGLYVAGTSNIAARWDGLLRFTVTG